MSFGGHVLDMIRRSKDNSEMLKRRREKTRDLRNKILKSGKWSYDSDISVEELDKINKDLKQHEIEKSHNVFRMKLIYLCCIVVGVIVLGILMTIFLF